MMHALVPANPGQVLDVKHSMLMSRAFAESGFFQDARGAAQALVKVVAGRELGFGPVASMTGIFVVKGRITLSANLMAAAIRRSVSYDYQVKQLDDRKCEIDFLKDGKLIGMSSFTLDDAQKAGLVHGDNWRKYPRNMLFARSLSNGAKWYCPDVFAGAPVYTPDELGAEVDGESGEVISVPADLKPDLPPTLVSVAQVEQLSTLIERTLTDRMAVLRHYAVAALDGLTIPQWEEAVRRLETKLQQTNNHLLAATAAAGDPSSDAMK